MINVTKTFLPPLQDYTNLLQGVWERAIVTNNGPLVMELENQLKDYFKLPMVHFVSNGTIAIQIALKALDITGEVITTPFSYVATLTSVLWENCTPVFVDIESESFCIDANLIEQAITPKTQAILATHVYGYPCAVKVIEDVANKHGLKVIYDAAHAFGTKVNGKSLLAFGDLSTLSLHATKLFHTIEGGAIVSESNELQEKIWLLKSFGHKYDDYFMVGINGKNSEIHAAMGLCLLPMVPDFIDRRRTICQTYDAKLAPCKFQRPIAAPEVEYNYAYYPIVFNSEDALLKTRSYLEKNGINTRRYFYPSLNTVPYLDSKQPCPVSEDIASRVLCLPLYYELSDSDVDMICDAVIQSTQNG